MSKHNSAHMSFIKKQTNKQKQSNKQNHEQNNNNKTHNHHYQKTSTYLDVPFLK